VPLSDDAAREPAASPLADASDAAAGQPPRRRGGRPKLVASKSGEPANDANVVELDKFRKK
jgi:hypothetical protein